MANYQEIHWSSHLEFNSIKGMSCLCPDGTMRCPWGNQHKLTTTDDEQIVSVYEADKGGNKVVDSDKLIEFVPDQVGVYPTNNVTFKSSKRIAEKTVRQIVIQYSDSNTEYCIEVLLQNKGSYNEISIQI